MHNDFLFYFSIHLNTSGTWWYYLISNNKYNKVMAEYVEKALEELLLVFEQLNLVQLFTTAEIDEFIKSCRASHCWIKSELLLKQVNQETTEANGCREIDDRLWNNCPQQEALHRNSSETRNNQTGCIPTQQRAV